MNAPKVNYKVLCLYFTLTVQWNSKGGGVPSGRADKMFQNYPNISVHVTDGFAERIYLVHTCYTWYVSGSLLPVADSHMYTCPSLLAVNTIRSRSFHTIDLSSSTVQCHTGVETPLH